MLNLFHMVRINHLNIKSDSIGIMASTLCFLHCLATPLLFIGHVSASPIKEHYPLWWGTLDVLFLGVSFFAVYWSTLTTSKTWIKYAFWFSWILLSLTIMTEKLELWPLPEVAIYPPTIGLIVLHFYNRRYYCNCEEKNCCTTN